MTSRRSNLLGVVLGAFLSIAALGTANAQVPRSISYQGLLIKNGQPVNAQANLKINIYNAAGTLLYTESYNQVQVNNGVFNVNIGASKALENLKFDEQYFLGVEVDGTPEILPHTPFTAAPYALNAQTVGGIGVSTTPAPGMLLPLDQNGKIPTSVLPQSTSLVSVNGLTGDSLGNVQILGVNGITVLSDAITNKITIGMATTGGIVDTIYPGPGIDVINPIGTQHTVQIANNGITPGMIGTGAVLGRNLDQNIPQLGLYQDALGDLNIGINSTLTYINPPGNHAIGINLANPNTWTGTQTFSASPIGIIVTTTAQFNGPVVITGTPEPAAAVNGATYELQLNGDFRATGSTTIQGNTFIGAGPTNTTNTIGNVASQPANSVLGLTNNVTAQSTGATAATNSISASGTASGNSNNITASGTGASNNIQAPTNNVGTTNSGSVNTIGNAGTSTNTVTGATNNVTGT
ncbi:MAG: hypothetical protein JSS75_14000, partial [Bacteroidetes bacterium]|nr:hypothetical protein [Bacteroidota bacterium]